MPKVAPYFLYTLDFKKKEEQKLGRTLSNAEASQMASESWNAMSDDQKAVYKEKAKGGDVQIAKRSCGAKVDTATNKPPGSRSGLFTSQGVPTSLYEQERKEKTKELTNMRLRIANLVQKLPLMTDFLDYPLFFMYGNYFYKNYAGIYCPAEIAMIKFTFREGVLSQYHDFIQPEKVDFGFAYEAKSFSESTHRLPPPPNAYGEKNFDHIYYKIKKFLMEGREPVFDGGKHMVFTYSDESVDSQIDVLKDFLRQFAGEKDHGIDIFPLTRLFYALRNELAANGRGEVIPNENFTNVFLSRDPYEALAGISCPYHEQIDATRYCAQSRVRRFTFLMADHFCQYLGVKPEPGNHLPPNVDLSQSIWSSSGESSTSGSQYQETESDREGNNSGRDVYSSSASLAVDAQSMSSSTPSQPTRKRQSRGSMLAQNKAAHSNISSTFYNQP